MVLVRFNIFYQTNPGQDVRVVGNIDELGGWNPHNALIATWDHDDWTVEVELNVTTECEVQYKYVVLDRNFGTIFWEDGSNRRLRLETGLRGPWSVHDTWRNPSDPDSVFHTATFRDAIFSRVGTEQAESVLKALERAEANPPPSLPSSPKEEWELVADGELIAVKFKLDNTRLDHGTSLYVCGNHPCLGGWDATKALKMFDKDFPTFEAVTVVARRDFPLMYKYVILDDKGEADALWETGKDRKVSIPPYKPYCKVCVVTDYPFQFPIRWRGAGTAIPVFALRTNDSVGCGEFLDLKVMADWCHEAGLCVIQLLPVNDTQCRGTWKDSYPYGCMSVFALHPQYIRLSAIRTDLPPSILAKIDDARRTQNTPEIDYEKMIRVKLELLHEIWDLERPTFIESQEFKDFYEENYSWLAPYALSLYFRRILGCPDPRQWGILKSLPTERLAELCDRSQSHWPELAFWYFVQYHLHIQLLEASTYCKSKHVALKGDLPIGVDPRSVDCWVHPELFRLHKQAGAPPDAFSAGDGQNWSFPTYNWEAMKKTGYSWWCRRLSQMGKYFHAYRIDHILGFFRIWEVPSHGVTGLLGTFNPVNPLWEDELKQCGIWDLDRLCNPYIRLYHLESMFGHQWERIRDTYFVEYYKWCYAFKSEYNTQKKVEAALELPEDAPQHQKEEYAILKGHLFRLLSEVILIRDDIIPHAYHPRITMFKTDSFRELPDDWRRDLYRLYISYYYERQDETWRTSAMEKLPIMRTASSMLVCGEDLGMVPKCVTGLMNEMAITSLRIQRMPSDPELDFSLPWEYPYLSVAAPSCHDMPTIRGWFEDRSDGEKADKVQKIFNMALHESGPAPAQCATWISRRIIDQHLHSPSMLAIFPVQDLLGLEERLMHKDPTKEQINDPSNANHYWRYRMHLKIEDLLKEKEFTKAIRSAISSSGRHVVPL